MRQPIEIDEVVFTPAGRRDRGIGIEGYARCRLNGCLELDGLTVRRSARGDRIISFPRRPTGRYLVRPLDDETRLEIQRQILEALA